MKRVISVAAVLFLTLFCLCGCEEETKLSATKEFYVNDFANVISDSDERELLSKAVTLQEATTAQVVVLTVDDLNGDEPWHFATEISNEWGIGDEEKDNGILVLLSVGDREVFVAVGEGLEGNLPDSKTGRIIDVYGLEKLRQDDFSGGIKDITNAVINEVYIAYSLETPEGYVPIESIKAEEDVSPSQVIVSWLILIVIVVLFSLLTRRHGGLLFMPIGFGGFRGGRFGGGSSGGFGGFRGGGGSFGGGGAGRGF